MVTITTMKVSQDHVTSLMSSPAKLEVIRQLVTGGILTERRLAQYAGLSHVSVSRILEECERLHLAFRQRVGKANQWRINNESYAYQALRPILEALVQVSSPRDALIQLIKKYSKKTVIRQVILYGSVIEGKEEDQSDVDLCLILRPGIRKDDVRLEKILETLVSRCYQLFGKRLSPYVVTQKEWQEKKQSAIGQGILKGKIIVA